MAKFAHPLDPLSFAEIQATAAAVRTAVLEKGLENLRFNTITLKEPAKKELVSYEANEDSVPPRCAFAIIQCWPKLPLVEVIVDLSSSPPSVSSWDEKQDAEPLASPDDCELAEAITKADAEVQALLKERNITQLDLVACDPWSVNDAPSGLGRVIQLFMYVRTHPDDNHYAHPLDFVPVADLNLKKIVRIDKQYEAPPHIPDRNVNYHRNLMEKEWRTDLKPLNIVQPEGPSFTVEGNLIKWQKWHIRVSFNSREGLVLHNVGYEDNGKVRPIVHRASLVEMAVPYADTNPPFHRKCAFDVGDYGLGFCANSLELGCDCVGNIFYFDGLMNDSKGEPWEVKKAVCVHEEDVGLLWKHMEYRNGHSESRRSRRLVLSFTSTVVNYEYNFNWYFQQDGTIEFEIKLTGELSTNLLSPGEDDPEFGTLVAPGVNAQHHQHMFCARLDMAVDDPDGGAALVVSEQDFVPLPLGPKNPHGNGFRAVETDLTSELKAMRCADPFKGRVWKIKNPDSIHPITGKPVAYKLVGTPNPFVFADPQSTIGQRAQFAMKNLWVTPYNDRERYPAGDYTIGSKGNVGLSEWVKQDRPIAGHDPVIWHCFGISHATRVEDFPVMPVEHVGFKLKAANFFDGNPGVDVPPTVNGSSKLFAGPTMNGTSKPGATPAMNGTNGTSCH
ncbi:Copper amine oxidase [Klebsormidium nitens]|uniref:Amine oxidase n=1 Tax=Klebsormidium nitens TaxID=105231 RepID=A0A1Y1HXE1_KLENI|nr:Copper amine oxidase [Klebsormidium nitens]|eukprot:GAQ81207.1 Copper amine oxidase [Klebsormidium nitens]